MPSILIRNLSDRLVKRLKARAKLNGRSLQQECRAILEREADKYTPTEMQDVIAKWRKHFAGRTFSDSAALICKDRESH